LTSQAREDSTGRAGEGGWVDLLRSRNCSCGSAYRRGSLRTGRFVSGRGLADDTSVDGVTRMSRKWWRLRPRG